uniref:Uncharacterized protein n=1 Tax=Nicotiana tabacum TaxID=4097 RepID=A0A1S4D4L6_TOBAC|nr:PREDICTED: uncharacterized protein LOC107825934 [Nicotiana tabacum]
MANTSATWQSRANVPQWDPSMVNLTKQMEDQGEQITKLTTTLKLLAKNQMPMQVNAMENVQGSGFNQTSMGNQFLGQEGTYFAQGSHQEGDFQEQCYQMQNEGAQYVDDEEEEITPPRVVDPPKVDVSVVESNVVEEMQQTPSSLQDVIYIPPKGNEVIKEETKEASKSYKKLPRPSPPYLQRFAKQHKEGQLQKFYDMLNQIIVTVPFVEALEKMPGYAKFMKDLVTKKKNSQSDTSVQCNHFTNQNENDVGCEFTIPCSIGVTSCAKAHNGRLGVFNLMPYAVLKRFGLGDPRPTSMKLLMADQTLKYLFGVIDVILVKVGHLYFPDDFVIMDCEVDREVPIILGRPVLATGQAI